MYTSGKVEYMKVILWSGTHEWGPNAAAAAAAAAGRLPRPDGCLGALKRTKTGRAPMLMVGAWVRAPSIGRSEPPGALCLGARSAAACAACLGGGSAAKSLVRACIGRLSEPAGAGRARWLRRLAGSCCAEVLPVTAAEAGRALGPMLPSSARELWPFCVLRDSCHAAVPDEPGLPYFGSVR